MTLENNFNTVKKLQDNFDNKDLEENNNIEEFRYRSFFDTGNVSIIEEDGHYNEKEIEFHKKVDSQESLGGANNIDKIKEFIVDNNIDFDISNFKPALFQGSMRAQTQSGDESYFIYTDIKKDDIKSGDWITWYSEKDKISFYGLDPEDLE